MAAASSHAARAEGSTGHADGGGSFGGGWTLPEEVFPMTIEWGTRLLEKVVQIENHPSTRPRFCRGEASTSTENVGEERRKCSVNCNMSLSKMSP